MKQYILPLIVLLICSCNSGAKRVEYIDSTDKYYLTIEKSEMDGIIDSLYTFYDFYNPTIVKQVGFYLNGFRNDVWSYDFDDSVKECTWAHYRDKFLFFETSIFNVVDTIKHADFYTKFLFTTDIGKITLSISINGPLKDSLPEKNYERFAINEFNSLGAHMSFFNISKLSNSPNNIFITKIIAKTATNNIRYITGLYSFIDKDHFIEFSVGSDKENRYSDILFNAVLTDFVIDGKHLYNPIR